MIGAVVYSMIKHSNELIKFPPNNNEIMGAKYTMAKKVPTSALQLLVLLIVLTYVGILKTELPGIKYIYQKSNDTSHLYSSFKQ